MVVVADAAVVALLTRAPGRGGKSRLFAELQIAGDPVLLTALLLDTLDGVAVPGVARVIAVEPPDACDEVRAIAPADVAVVPQASGDLGDRMRALMADLFARGARAVVLVGSDLPDIETGVVADAFAELAVHPDAIVVGPALDGGYYLLGAAGRVPPVFDAIRWGSADVLSQTRAAAERHDVPVVLVAPSGDVDTLADLRRVTARRTREWRRAFFGEE